MQKTPEQRIMELEAEVKLLEKQKAFLEREAYIADKKVIFFDTMINIAESEEQIDIRRLSGINKQVYYRSEKRSVEGTSKAEQPLPVFTLSNFY